MLLRSLSMTPDTLWCRSPCLLVLTGVFTAAAVALQLNIKSLISHLSWICSSDVPWRKKQKAVWRNGGRYFLPEVWHDPEVFARSNHWATTGSAVVQKQSRRRSDRYLTFHRRVTVLPPVLCYILLYPIIIQQLVLSGSVKSARALDSQWREQTRSVVTASLIYSLRRRGQPQRRTLNLTLMCPVTGQTTVRACTCSTVAALG